MCQASKVTNDWVVKGCHIHIGGIELAVFPDHKGSLNFRPFFKVTPERATAVANALKMAQEECLPNPEIRERWIRSLNQGTTYMLSYVGQLSSRANGRMLEFKFLKIALERYQE
jgi:hypothetical protein